MNSILLILINTKNIFFHFWLPENLSTTWRIALPDSHMPMIIRMGSKFRMRHTTVHTID